MNEIRGWGDEEHLDLLGRSIQAKPLETKSPGGKGPGPNPKPRSLNLNLSRTPRRTPRPQGAEVSKAEPSLNPQEERRKVHVTSPPKRSSKWVEYRFSQVPVADGGGNTQSNIAGSSNFGTKILGSSIIPSGNVGGNNGLGSNIGSIPGFSHISEGRDKGRSYFASSSGLRNTPRQWNQGAEGSGAEGPGVEGFEEPLPAPGLVVKGQVREQGAEEQRGQGFEGPRARGAEGPRGQGAEGLRVVTPRDAHPPLSPSRFGQDIGYVSGTGISLTLGYVSGTGYVSGHSSTQPPDPSKSTGGIRSAGSIGTIGIKSLNRPSTAQNPGPSANPQGRGSKRPTTAGGLEGGHGSGGRGPRDSAQAQLHNLFLAHYLASGRMSHKKEIHRAFIPSMVRRSPTGRRTRPNSGVPSLLQEGLEAGHGLGGYLLGPTFSTPGSEGDWGTLESSRNSSRFPDDLNRIGEYLGSPGRPLSSISRSTIPSKSEIHDSPLKGMTLGSPRRDYRSLGSAEYWNNNASQSPRIEPPPPLVETAAEAVSDAVHSSPRPVLSLPAEEVLVGLRMPVSPRVRESGIGSASSVSAVKPSAYSSGASSPPNPSNPASLHEVQPFSSTADSGAPEGSHSSEKGETVMFEGSERLQEAEEMTLDRRQTHHKEMTRSHTRDHGPQEDQEQEEQGEPHPSAVSGGRDMISSSRISPSRNRESSARGSSRPPAGSGDATTMGLSPRDSPHVAYSPRESLPPSSHPARPSGVQFALSPQHKPSAVASGSTPQSPATALASPAGLHLALSPRTQSKWLPARPTSSPRTSVSFSRSLLHLDKKKSKVIAVCPATSPRNPPTPPRKGLKN